MQEVYQCNVDLFASRLNHQLPQFISWRPDPYTIETDALQVPWTRWRGYAFPLFALISKVLRKVREEGSTNSSDSSGLGIVALVPSSAIHAGGLPNIVTDPQRSTDRHIRTTSPINAGESASIIRMDTVRQGYTTEGISAEAAQLLLSGWSKGTNTAYQSAWKKSVSWCIPW